jgi:hypothetical protein
MPACSISCPDLNVLCGRRRGRLARRSADDRALRNPFRDRARTYRQTTRTRPPGSVRLRHTRLPDVRGRDAGLDASGAGGVAGGGKARAAAGSGSAVGRTSRRIQRGSSVETAGGLFMTTVPSDVRVHAATGASPQHRTIARLVLPICAPHRGTLRPIYPILPEAQPAWHVRELEAGACSASRHLAPGPPPEPARPAGRGRAWAKVEIIRAGSDRCRPCRAASQLFRRP